MTTIGIVGYYWFATTITSDPFDSWSIGFDSFSVGKYSNNRYFGFSIRLIYSDQIFQAGGNSGTTEIGVNGVYWSTTQEDLTFSYRLICNEPLNPLFGSIYKGVGLSIRGIQKS